MDMRFWLEQAEAEIGSWHAHHCARCHPRPQPTEGPSHAGFLP